MRSERLRPVAVRTLLRRQTSLRVFARYLRQYHPDGDFAPPESISVPEAAGRRASGTRSLTAEQIEAVQSELGRSTSVHARRDAAIISLCLSTGISVEELLALNVADIRLSEGMLLLRGKNNLPRRVPVGDAVGPMQTYLILGRLEIGPLPGENALFISRSGARLTRQGVLAGAALLGGSSPPERAADAQESADHRGAQDGRRGALPEANPDQSGTYQQPLHPGYAQAPYRLKRLTAPTY